MNRNPQDSDFPAFFHEEGGDLKVHQASFIEFLAEQGYRKVYAESDMESSLVYIEDGVIHRTSKELIQDFVMEQVRNISEKEVPDPYKKVDYEDTLIRGSNVYFARDRLRHLPPVDVEFNHDTREVSFFYFENGFVRVTKEGHELKNYEALDGAIWSDQIVNREFKSASGKKVGIEESDWYRFLCNATGGNGERLTALCSSIGYLLHGYKDPAVAKAIVFLDEAISDVPSGRTGKSLVAEALQKLVPVHRVDARNFNFGSQFSFQSVGIEDQIIDFNDASKGFNFEKLFSAITDDIQVERKYQDEITIPFEDSPKFLLSTNHVIEGEGASFEDRVFQIEFAPHYGADHRPIDEFGHRLFDDWDQEEWCRFDNLMMLFVQQYLRNGLQGYEHKNLKKRKLRQETTAEFAEWILEQDPGEYDKSELHKAFKAEASNGHPENFVLSQKKFTRMCNTYGRIYTGEKLPSRKSGEDRYIALPNVSEE